MADYIKPSFAEEWFEPMKNELHSKPQYNSAEVRTQLVSAANKIKSFENPKQNDGNVEWINKGFATYIDKEKAHAFLSHLSAPIAETAAKAELDSATNIIDNFENPKQNDGNLRLRTSEELDRDYPNWNDTQTTSKGGHSTQITGTVSTSV